MIEYSWRGELSKRTGSGLVNLAKGVLKTDFSLSFWSRKHLNGSSSGCIVFPTALRLFAAEEHSFL